MSHNSWLAIQTVLHYYYFIMLSILQNSTVTLQLKKKINEARTDSLPKTTQP